MCTNTVISTVNYIVIIIIIIIVIINAIKATLSASCCRVTNDVS